MSEIYDFLVKVKNGYDPGWSNLSFIDDLLGNLNFNEKNPGLSVVTIEFNDYESYLDLFEDLDSSDKHEIKYFLNKEEFDWDPYNDELWINGYIYNLMNSENKEKMEKIFMFISKSPNGSIREKLINFEENFEDAVSNINSEWVSTHNECVKNNLYNEMISEFGNKFHYVGIREKYPLYQYKVSVNILLKLFNLFNLKDGSLQDLLSAIIKKFDRVGHGGGEYYELPYSIGCDDFDEYTFNRNIEWYINKVLDDIMDDEKYGDIEEYFDIKSTLTNEYGFGTWNEIPRSKNIAFRIDQIDPRTNKIEITIRYADKNREEKRSLTYDELKQMETQYELFNEIKKIKKFFVI